MRIVGSLVVKNEADRYLQSCLGWNSAWWDELFVFDDQSSDKSVEICRRHTDSLETRTERTPTFFEHEGVFRRHAWQIMSDVCNLKSGDWVFSFDADEFLVGATQPVDLRLELERLAEHAEQRGLNSVSIPIPEIWSLDEPLKVRTDGFWATMRLPRFCRFIEGSDEWMPKAMGCGSTPLYSYINPLKDVESLRLLHVGWADQGERRARYERYIALKNHGHNPRHIASIVRNPTLKPWDGQVPHIYRGTNA